ncbi:hypothetical protein PILCRDRAFT_177691 [Piloderma croceum F 1598]|uniref:Carboxylic ester hydrolase n=1 Tax=Piloderma croceum (strain F 1598) TaxID=765440 RepID=A0A0C3GI00_PILCF|nr:hypothetical protein PILCRDRAFT_177691 [Piloderma croceum F 1598]
MEARAHLGEELPRNAARVVATTKHGQVKGGRAANGAAIFLEVPYALPPGRFEDPNPLPADFKYEDVDYIYERSYAVQPNNDGQAVGASFVSKVGLGKPTENPLFVNIACPPSFPSSGNFPVKVYIHGGFLQFGSPHSLSSQAQYVSAARSEVWVNIGYRLSAFGFLACDKPKISGNFGFKDQWMALEYIKDNISAFGGNPDDIQVTGLSAGAHSVHQLLHFASRLPPGTNAPFRSAVLQSNAMATNPKTPEEHRPQFHALCRALNLDPSASDILLTLRDPEKIPYSIITHVIETGAIGVEYGTFRGCLDGTWLSSSPDPMTWQRSGGFAKALWDKGVRSVIVGDLTEEWYLYSIAHPLTSPKDIVPNLGKYYPDDVVQRMMRMYKTLSGDATVPEIERFFGEMLSDGYEIRWTPEQMRPKGYVTHGTDRSLWTVAVPWLQPHQLDVARAWLDAISEEVKALESNPKTVRGVAEILTLKEDLTIEWSTDCRWGEMMKLATVLPGEVIS